MITSNIKMTLGTKKSISRVEKAKILENFDHLDWFHSKGHFEIVTVNNNRKCWNFGVTIFWELFINFNCVCATKIIKPNITSVLFYLIKFTLLMWFSLDRLPFEEWVVADLSNPCCKDRIVSSIFFGGSSIFGVSSIPLNPEPKLHKASKLFW